VLGMYGGYRQRKGKYDSYPYLPFCATTIKKIPLFFPSIHVPLISSKLSRSSKRDYFLT